MIAMTQWVYRFGPQMTEGNKDMKDILGGKGANLAEMNLLGLPVPPGLTISTGVCSYYYTNDKQFPPGMMNAVYCCIEEIEKKLEKKFGCSNNPLLLSVRSGSRSSMPGMMDTILNLGLNETTVAALAISTSNPVFALDCYRRFIQMFSSVVMKVDHHLFESALATTKEQHNYKLDSDLSEQDLRFIITTYKQIVFEHTGNCFPQDVKEQLHLAIAAVFASWMNVRAVTYREMYNIPVEWGTAVNIQSMVFGNKGEQSGTGVLFTRDPSTGEQYLYGEYLLNAQGEDVVAGIRTPQQISNTGKKIHGDKSPSLEECMPGVYKELLTCSKLLEHHYKDMQDIEFTIEDGKVWILQTRNGNRSIAAAIKVAVTLCDTGIISREQAILRISAEDISHLLHPGIDRSASYTVMAKGLAASPGAATGVIAFDAATATVWAAEGRNVILVRPETSPEDIAGMKVSKAILTTRGGMTSHAAVVARGMGIPCITGISELFIDTSRNMMKAGKYFLPEGDTITMDGTSGEIMLGVVPMKAVSVLPELDIFLSWCDSFRKLKIRANADTPEDCSLARKLGAEGIGLCRTEHMFFDAERIFIFRQMIFASNNTERKEILNRLIEFQRNDFTGIFVEMAELPVTIRLLDPPLHEFLPHNNKEIEELGKACNLTPGEMNNKMAALKEANPMLGHRGCRLAITYPEIYIMQVRAIIEAAIAVQLKGITVFPEIMVPLVMHPAELESLQKIIRDTATDVCNEKGVKINYTIGTMIELPRTALIAPTIAPSVSFFSFGTNDLTQTTLGISRDDSSSFMPCYIAQGLFAKDPFEELDKDGVGRLISICIEEAKATNPLLKIGICGEHGGNPASIEFFHKAGMEYVSCSPYRLPIARVAAAQEAIKQSDK